MFAWLLTVVAGEESWLVTNVAALSASDRAARLTWFAAGAGGGGGGSGTGAAAPKAT